MRWTVAMVNIREELKEARNAYSQYSSTIGKLGKKLPMNCYKQILNHLRFDRFDQLLAEANDGINRLKL